MALAVYGATHVGRRPTNEDAFLVDERLGLFVVADGMGGHQAGEVASGIAVKAIHDVVAVGEGQSDGVELLDSALRRANEDILAAADRQAGHAGMGTTVVAAMVDGHTAAYTGVGDSRIYLWRGDVLTQLTRDDTWIAHVLPESASMGSSDIQRHPMRHVLTKVVGLREELELVVDRVELRDGDVMLLCSDGLHGCVPDARIAAALKDGPAVKEIVDRLIAEAVEAGGTDNVTAVAIKLN
jgi:protein phosphatase